MTSILLCRLPPEWSALATALFVPMGSERIISVALEQVDQMFVVVSVPAEEPDRVDGNSSREESMA